MVMASFVTTLLAVSTGTEAAGSKDFGETSNKAIWPAELPGFSFSSSLDASISRGFSVCGAKRSPSENLGLRIFGTPMTSDPG